MPYIGSGTYSQLIITAEMQTPAASLLDAAAAYHRSQAGQWAEVQAARESANVRREQAIVSPGSQAMHTAHRQAVQYIRVVKDLHLEAASMYDQQASALRYVDQQQANIDKAAHEKISQAKSKAEIPEIVAQHNLSAKTITSRTAAEIQGQFARWEATGGAELLSIASRIAQDTPRDPIRPTPNPSPGVVTPLGHRRDRDRPAVPDDRGDTPKQSQAGDAATAADSGNLGKRAGQGIGKPDDAFESGGRIGHLQESPGGSVAGSAPAARTPISPLGGGGMPSTGGGGLGSGGSGLGSGMGSNPLSSMMGLGQNPASSMTSGLSGAATNPASSASSASSFNPGSAFAKGLSSAAGSGITPISNTPVAPPAAASAPSGVAGPQAVSGIPPAASAPAASGMHSVASAAPAAATGGPSPMMLPSTGMGAPAAGATAAVAPVGSSSSNAAGGGVGGAGVSAAASSGNAGPTLVPAGVVNAAATTQPGRILSADAHAAAALAWQLQHACLSVGFPLDWAVGVFRSEHGSETVVISAEGSGYVPAGVYVPRSAQLLVADPVVDKAFRDEWFGWPDPAQVMVEYARRRAGTGWEMVAAATNGPVDHFRNCGVEYADSCSYDRSPLTKDHPAPTLDEMHAHRLQLEYPDLYDRLVRLAGADQVYVERVIVPMTAGLVTTARGLEHPAQLAHMWSMIVNGGSPTQEQWSEYAQVASTDFLTTTVHRPETAGGPEEWKTIVYRDAWTVSRALECVAGWAAAPMPLADMVYAVAAADPGSDVREVIGTALRAVEGELGWL